MYFYSVWQTQRFFLVLQRVEDWVVVVAPYRPVDGEGYFFTCSTIWCDGCAAAGVCVAKRIFSFLCQNMTRLAVRENVLPMSEYNIVGKVN